MANSVKYGSQALSLLMSVPELEERRNLVAEDAERRVGPLLVRD